MVDWQVRRITKEVQRHDKNLFAKRSHTGKVQIFRKAKTYRKEVLDNCTLFYLVDAPQYVISLTDDWSGNGKNVEWGLEPIRQRLKAIDLWSNEQLFEEIMNQNEEVDVSNERNLKNNTENFLYEFRDQFKKTFNNVNTANLSKLDRRRVDDRRIKNGNFKQR